MTKKQWIWLVCGLAVTSQLPAAFVPASNQPSETPKAEVDDLSRPVVTPQSRTERTQVATAPARVRMSDLPPMDNADRAIGTAINLNGHLCARPIVVKEVGTQMYAVRCITRRDGSGVSDYLVNARTSEVEPI